MNAESPMSDGAPSPQPPEAPSGPDPTAPAPARGTGHTRLSRTWAGVIIGVVILAFLLAFIIQNSQSVKVSIFTVSGHLPLGVALLLAAVAGVLLAAIVASLRIWQLRHRLHRSKRPRGSSVPAASPPP
jgi:uncharacterized integral membrane protein